ncbi:hypothetical protein KKD62_01220 [Patescibacteria group bacterium]|nr:hypothetical protein [Patescibacteria group bacterium]MBU1931432.1 hypothetical protein [Patescibacteria group bacterium]
MKKNLGFVYIELIVSLAIVLIIIVTVIVFQTKLSESQIFILKSHLTTEAANSLLSQIARELRTMRPSENSDYPLSLTDDQSLIFYADYDFDGVVERMRYSLNNTVLEKGIIEPTADTNEYLPENEISREVTNSVRNGDQPVFFYYNGDWPSDEENNPLDTPTRLSETKLIKISITTNVEEDRPEGDFILESFVQLRTLKDNL